MKKFILSLCLTLCSSSLWAHCPASFKEEKLCFMLENNLLYLYDHKLEHNGPYKDFEKAQLASIKTPKGDLLTFQKVARGIYKLDSKEKFQKLVLGISLENKLSLIKISHE